MRLLVATSLAAVSGHHAEARVGGGFLLESTFPVLLPAGVSGGPPPLVWWPTQTNRQGDGGPLGPYVIERGGIQIN